jgi:hypothetical protein
LAVPLEPAAMGWIYQRSAYTLKKKRAGVRQIP